MVRSFFSYSDVIRHRGGKKLIDLLTSFIQVDLTAFIKFSVLDFGLEN